MTTKFCFRKKERLCSLKLIEKLFAEGKSIYQFPIKVVYLKLDIEARYPVQAAFSVSKKNIRKATTRNLLRRRMKEIYRLNKTLILQHLTNINIVIMFIYSAPEIQSFEKLEKAMKIVMTKLCRIFKSAGND